MDNNNAIEQLKKYDTPSITNVVATYPGDTELCLGLYNPWKTNWYTDETLRCIYPELGRTVGYAVTCIYGPADPGFRNRLTFYDILQAVEASPKPCILVIKQDFPDEIKRKNGLSGGNMTTALKTVGCVGVISDGPSRDIDEIRPMKIQYMLTGVTAGHGEFSVMAVNVPVSVCGMDVAPGDIIHMDENGAVKFPANKINDVAALAEKLQKKETDIQARMRNASNAAEVFNIMSGK